VENFNCGQLVDTFRYHSPGPPILNQLPTGEAAQITAQGTGAADGAPVNCNTGPPGGVPPNPGLPCPATPAPGNYPVVP
jgi:hypothetical protein